MQRLLRRRAAAQRVASAGSGGPPRQQRAGPGSGEGSLSAVREQLANLKDLLAAFRENDGKAEIVEEIIEAAAKMPDDRAIGCLALIHGPAEMANRMATGVADFSINAALVLSVTFGLAFEAPNAVQDSGMSWVLPTFYSLIYASVFSHISTIVLMIWCNTALNGWAREADLLAMLWRGGHHVWNILLLSFAAGLVFAILAGVIAIYAETEEPLYFLLLLGLLLVVNWAMFPGMALYQGTCGDFDWGMRTLWLLNRPASVNQCKNGIFLLQQKATMQKEGKDLADFFDVPFDVLRKQAELGKMLDDDKWRQKELGISAPAAAKGAVVEDVDGPPHEVNSPPHEANPGRRLAEALNAVEAGFGELYTERMLAQCVEVSQLADLTRSELVSLLGVPLGHAMKIQKHFSSV